LNKKTQNNHRFIKVDFSTTKLFNMNDKKFAKKFEFSPQPFSGPFLYHTGRPLDFRFDAKDGIVKVMDIALTKPGEPFEMIPIAYRVFEGDILDERYGRRRWAEIFTVTVGGAVSSILFHEFSVEELEKLFSNLLYLESDLTDVKIKVTPDKVSGAHGPFYIARFSVVEEIDKSGWGELPEMMFRRDTLNGRDEQVSLLSLNVATAEQVKKLK
jgi:hypothetical protein